MISLLCGPRCKVLLSPNREEYHRLRFKEHQSFINLSRIAKERFDEQISHMSFNRHFKKHVSPLETYKGSPEEDEYLEKKAQERLNLLDEIESNLLTLKKMSEEAAKLPMKAANINAFSRLASEFRMTLQYVAQHKEAYLGGSEKLADENVISKIMDALKEIPEEYRKAVLEKLKEG